MNLETKPHNTYKSEITFLSIMTLILGINCIFFGYLLLPVAAGFYAALLSCEKKEGRILSYVLPLIPPTLSAFVLNTFYSLESIAYVIIGLMIYIGFQKKHNKTTTVLVSTLALLLLMFISFILLALNETGGTFKFEAIKGFYDDAYSSGKIKFTQYLTSFTSTDQNGVVFYNFNASQAVDLYNSFIIMMLPILVIFALVSVGISTRILSSRVRKYNPDDTRLVGWKFVTSPFIAYSYIVITVLAAISQTGVVGISLSFVATILMALYFYIGICATFNFISSKKGKRFAIILITLALFVFSSFTPQIISFIGVFVNNSAYKAKYSEKTGI